MFSLFIIFLLTVFLSLNLFASLKKDEPVFVSGLGVESFIDLLKQYKSKNC